MKASLKDLARGSTAPAAVTATGPTGASEIEPPASGPAYRTAQTRSDTRQVSGHFKVEVSQTLKLIAVEQDRDIQEILAEALNMVFERYGKPTRAEVTSGRRKKTTG
jgi:hypothetical protein